jgi:hypothetical protein
MSNTAGPVAKTNSSSHTFCVQGPGVLTFLLCARGFLFRQKKKSEANLWATRQSEESNTFDTKVPLVLSAADESP